MTSPAFQARATPEKLALAICSAVFCERFSAHVVASSLVFVLCRSHGLEQQSAVHLVGAFAGLNYIGTVPGGLIIDRWLGVARGLKTSLAMLVVGYLGLAVLKNWALALTLVVLGNSLFKPSAPAALSRVVSKEPAHQVKVQLWAHLAVNLGIIAGSGFAGVALRLTSPERFLGVAGLAVVIGMLIGFFFVAVPTVPPATRLLAATKGGASPWFASPRLYGVAALVANFLVNVAYGQVEGSTLAALGEQVTVLGHVVPASWFVGLPALMVICLTPLQLREISGLQDRIGPLRLLGTGLLFSAISLFPILPLLLPEPVYNPIARMLLFDAGMVMAEILIVPVGLAVVGGIASNDWIGVMMGMWYVSGAAGLYTSGRIGGLAIQQHDPRNVLVAGMVAFVAGVVFLFVGREWKKTQNSEKT